MQKTGFCLFILFFISFSLFADGVEPYGSGWIIDPYIVEVAENLLWISTNDDSWGSYFIQTQNIDAYGSCYWHGGLGLDPIGNEVLHFCGHYNGQGYTISNLYIEREGEQYIGLFGITEYAVLKNINLIDVSISGGDYTGALVGKNISNTVITNSYSSGSVTGCDFIGGLIGLNHQDITIDKCKSSVIVDGSSSSGGLIGGNENNSTISNCFSTGVVSGDEYTGGLVGNVSYCTILNCYATGSVDGDWYAAGLVASGSNTNIINCYSCGFVSDGLVVGGLCADNYLTVENSFWDIETSGQATSAGGIGLTTNEMQMYSTFYEAGWDFIDETTNGTDDFWGINSDENDGYPFLEWQGFTHNPVNIENDIIQNEDYLFQNFPNPFNPSTTISFNLTTSLRQGYAGQAEITEDTEIVIFNLKGQMIKTFSNLQISKSPNHQIVWDGTDQTNRSVSSGIYFAKLKIGKVELSRKMLLMK